MTGTRLAAPRGSRLDRSRPLSFTFNGRVFSGFAGDTLASALLANGVQLIGRSFKLHRPRGIFSCGVEEPSGLVDLGEGALRTPNQRATLVELEEGMVAVSINCWPSVGVDLGAVNDTFGAMLPAGFYYKTFKWPNWHFFEPAIRRMAGLGRAAEMPDPDRYEEMNAAADVVVVGAGLAGLGAAAEAAAAGSRTFLISGSPGLGGALGERADPQIAGLVAAVARAGVTVLTRTLAFGIYDHGLLCARQSLPSVTPTRSGGRGVLRERLWKIRARATIVAAGAFERPMLFPDNDRPGVMLAGAADRYLHAFGVACGSRVVIAANSDSAYAVAGSLQRAGVEVVALVDRRDAGAVQGSVTGVRVIGSSGLSQVSGRRSVRGCTVIPVDGAVARREKLDCDLILSAGGFAPAVHLHSQAGGRLRWLDDASMFVPDGAPSGVFSVGACAGVFDRQAALEHAAETGRALGGGRSPPTAPARSAGHSLGATHISGVRGKQFVDLQNDVAMGDVGLAAQENYRSVEHLKRYTTTGMGTDQGKTSNINALVLMGEFTGREPDKVGTTRFRPPFAPVSLGSLVGRRVGAAYRPLKHLPMEAWHHEHNAAFEQFGAWLRPAAYPHVAETLEQAAQREAFAVRRSVGLFDGSPLGKLEVYGADAAKFLDLMYVGTMSGLSVGQARYGVVLNENGIVMDDGIVARLGEKHFWVNTTSAGVERTTAAFEEWLQCEYPELEVLITPVTSRWGNVTIAGPRAWNWLASVGFSSQFAPHAMQHMTMRAGMFEEIAVRVLRASFSGELGYEINVPVDHMESVLRRLWSGAAEFGAVLYGIEAMEVLRTEKGFIHIGTDTDGTTLPQDVGFARAFERKTANFVGRRSLLRPAARDPERLQLVALSPADGATLLPVGAQIAAAPPPTRSEGHVTSSYQSPTLGAPVALAMLVRGFSRVGERVRVHHLGTSIDAVVVKAPFLDPAGERLHA